MTTSLLRRYTVVACGRSRTAASVLVVEKFGKFETLAFVAVHHHPRAQARRSGGYVVTQAPNGGQATPRRATQCWRAPVQHLPVLAAPFVFKLLDIQAANGVPVGLVQAEDAVAGRFPVPLCCGKGATCEEATRKRGREVKRGARARGLPRDLPAWHRSRGGPQRGCSRPFPDGDAATGEE